MTYRENRERRAERLDGWADKRETDAAAVLERNRTYTGDIAFNTQPGHIPLRARVIRQNDRAIESAVKARGMHSRADGIRSQLDSSIYSDDPDAIEALDERIEALEAERDRVKRFNAACRRAGKLTAEALEILSPEQRRDYRGTVDACPYMIGKAGQMPAYVLQNLGGNITRQRQRLEHLKREQQNRTAEVETETTGADGVTVRRTAARVEVEFPSKPDAEVRDGLKAHGFRWDRVAGCWWVLDIPTHAAGVEYAESFTR